MYCVITDSEDNHARVRHILPLLIV